MTTAEANRRQAEIWARDINHENNLMRPIAGDEVCTAFSERVIAFCAQYGSNYTHLETYRLISCQ